MRRVRKFIEDSKDSEYGVPVQSYGCVAITKMDHNQFQLFIEELELLLKYRQTIGEILKPDNQQ